MPWTPCASFPRNNVTPADSNPGAESSQLGQDDPWIPAFAGMTKEWKTTWLQELPGQL